MSTTESYNENLGIALKRVEELEAWVNDLHSGMYINCVYCGHQYGPKDETDNMRDALHEHISKCSKHPLGLALVENARLQSEVETLKKELEDAHKRIMVLSKHTKHKCDSCQFDFPTCDSTSEGCVTFGIDDDPNAKGADADVVLRCKTYKPIFTEPTGERQ